MWPLPRACKRAGADALPIEGMAADAVQSVLATVAVGAGCWLQGMSAAAGRQYTHVCPKNWAAGRQDLHCTAADLVGGGDG